MKPSSEDLQASTLRFIPKIDQINQIVYDDIKQNFKIHEKTMNETTKEFVVKTIWNVQELLYVLNLSNVLNI